MLSVSKSVKQPFTCTEQRGKVGTKSKVIDMH